MDKKTEEVIKEVIEDILELRKKKLRTDIYDDTSFFYPNEESQRERKERIKYRQKRTMKEFDIPLVKLNNILKKEEQYAEVIEIEKQMKKLQSKKYINVKEFTEIYGLSSDWQKNRRATIRNRLPFIQTVNNGKITYCVEELKIWFENNNIRK
ncbi:hypothetical protein [Arcobacter cloacae]|uniref:Uncharacterized protein n=1 Tax=Arcobacter cloacae TaxID=1054034 RepID=A0A4Q0ZD13_9BACT|nr:hypothetical protein [Arcobacter cloacae]RXJ83580.1 hypothetical protein CRU90_09330 [Arcobacter cloacae]